MMHTSDALYDMLRKSLVELDKQIEAVKTEAEKQIAVLPYPDLVDVYQIQDRNGKFILTDLIVAKLNCLASMSNLKAAQDNVRSAGKKR